MQGDHRIEDNLFCFSSHVYFKLSVFSGRSFDHVLGGHCTVVGIDDILAATAYSKSERSEER